MTRGSRRESRWVVSIILETPLLYQSHIPVNLRSAWHEACKECDNSFVTNSRDNRKQTVPGFNLMSMYLLYLWWETGSIFALGQRVSPFPFLKLWELIRIFSPFAEWRMVVINKSHLLAFNRRCMMCGVPNINWWNPPFSETVRGGLSGLSRSVTTH